MQKIKIKKLQEIIFGQGTKTASFHNVTTNQLPPELLARCTSPPLILTLKLPCTDIVDGEDFISNIEPSLTFPV